MVGTVRGQVQQPGLLYGALQGKRCGYFLQGVAAWRGVELSAIKAAVGALPDSERALLVVKADAALAAPWPALPASLYLDYSRTGNRIRFEALQGERRKLLSRLVAGFLASDDGKYLPAIGDDLVGILEESTWVLPAHLVVQKSQGGFPDPGEQVIDLGVAITAPLVASVQWMLRGELDRLSPNINKRVDAELERRVFGPYLGRDDFWWMGFKGQAVNNWNSWINANVLYAALLNERDTARLERLVDKVIRSTEYFVAQYPKDGGCEEGPSYWPHAGGRLVRLLGLLTSVSGGQLDFSGDTLLHRIGSYIGRVHIDEDYFVNIGDASAKTVPNPEQVYRYGQLFGDTVLKEMGAYLFRLQHGLNPDDLGDFLQAVEVCGDMERERPVAPMPVASWLDRIQVMTVRAKGGTAKGLFVAAQGGHNGESHNHNDVGNFTVYANGRPVLVDAGITVYNSATFGKDRYGIWTMQSGWHNCPLINGVMQQAGKKYAALDVTYRSTKRGATLSMELSKAYPDSAGVDFWKRAFVFESGKNSLVVRDAYALRVWKGATELHFLTCCKVQEERPGVLVLQNGTDGVRMVFDPKLFDLAVEEKLLDDVRLQAVWGQVLYRVVLRWKGQALKGASAVGFSLLGGKG